MPEQFGHFLDWNALRQKPNGERIAQPVRSALAKSHQPEDLADVVSKITEDRLHLAVATPEEVTGVAVELSHGEQFLCDFRADRNGYVCPGLRAAGFNPVDAFRLVMDQLSLFQRCCI